MVVPGRVEVVSHKTRPFGIYRRTTCSPFIVSIQLPELWWLVPSGSRSRVEAGARAKARVGYVLA